MLATKATLSGNAIICLSPSLLANGLFDLLHLGLYLAGEQLGKLQLNLV